MGQYLQGTQKSVQAWTIHGLAVKAALQLGLHSKDASKAFPSLEQETRKRTWFGCVVLDRCHHSRLPEYHSSASDYSLSGPWA